MREEMLNLLEKWSMADGWPQGKGCIYTKKLDLATRSWKPKATYNRLFPPTHPYMHDKSH